MVLYCIALYCIILYYIVLHCIALYCIVLHCIVLYYIAKLKLFMINNELYSLCVVSVVLFMTITQLV